VRRLWTVVALIGLLLVTAAMMSGAQGVVSSIFGRRDAANHVICYSAREGSDFLSCVYVPPDGTQVHLPQFERLPGYTPDYAQPNPKTT
jgi:hypothetical protein